MPENLSPEVDAQIVQGSETRFVWKAQEDVDSYDFHLFNRLDGDTVLNSRDEIPADEVCRDDECSISLEVMLPADDAHAWRVRAVNAEGKSGWSRSLMTVVAEG